MTSCAKTRNPPISFTITGIINRDFADIKTIMEGMGYAVMGTAVASGENRAVEATNRAIASPLLEDASINGAHGILLNITGSSKLTLYEVHEASTIVQKAAAENANIIFGAVHDESMGNAVKVTVIATGIKSEKMGIKPLSGLSPALRTAQQSLKSVMARKEKLPVEEQPANVTGRFRRTIWKFRPSYVAVRLNRSKRFARRQIPRPGSIWAAELMQGTQPDWGP